MKNINRSMFFSALAVLVYVLSACSGVPAVQSGNDQQSQTGQAQEVVFTGAVDAMGGGQWTVSGQAITVDGATSVDANIAVGDNVKVEARVGQDGAVTAISIEVAGADNANSNSNDDNQNDSNANDNASNSNDNQGDNSNSDNGNGNDNSNTGAEQEVSGVVEAITTEAIMINGVMYAIADFTEFKDLIAVGDQVKVHVIINADGTVSIREIEKSDKLGNDNGNSNNNGSDDNSNTNGNDDNGNNNNINNNNGNDDNGNSNGDDDNGNGNGDDDNGNSNDNNGNG